MSSAGDENQLDNLRLDCDVEKRLELTLFGEGVAWVTFPDAVVPAVLRNRLRLARRRARRAALNAAREDAQDRVLDVVRKLWRVECPGDCPIPQLSFQVRAARSIGEESLGAWRIAGGLIEVGYQNLVVVEVPIAIRCTSV